MTIRTEHDKARPQPPRSKDLATVPADAVAEAARKRTEGRTADGRFGPQNPHGFGARWKASIKRSLGPKTADGEVELIYGDALRIFVATLRAMPSDAAPVRSMAALHGRHMSLNGFFTTKAAEAGLTTDEGQKLQELADRQSQRAERVLVSCIDIATKLAPKGGRKSTVAEMRAAVTAAVAAKGGNAP